MKTVVTTTEWWIRFSIRMLLAVYDLLAVTGATIVAIILRFDYFRADILLVHRASIPFVLATYLLLFYLFRLYRYRWSFAGMEAIWSVLFANFLAAAVSIPWELYLDKARMPLSVVIMTWMLSTALIGGQRISLRWAARFLARRRRFRGKDHPQGERKRTIIMGTEQSVADVLNALAHEHAGSYDIIGILDADPCHHGSYLRGIKILGSWEMIHDLVQQHAVDEVIIALHNGSSAQLREYILTCCRHKVAVRMVPVTVEWLENPSASRRQLRVENIRAEDLLHRQSIQIKSEEAGRYLTGKRLMVTGAGGSIGSELCRQICRQNPALLVLVGHGENSIHQIRLELQRLYPELAANLVAVICDVRDLARVQHVIAHYRPQTLFHAAAHKHVPLMEENIAEAVNNNIGGTRNVIRTAVANKVERMVLVSTDKAVNPSNVMGATKFLCEEMMRAASQKNATCFITVRFGNVLGSRGSVLPRFLEQVLHGGPVTVTHPEMRRYFMTIPEAVSLILCAGGTGNAGELFLLDMGRPVRIINLAEDVIRLSGLVPYNDIQIEYSGLRPGEKLSEELFTEHEKRAVSVSEHLYVVNRPQYIDPARLDTIINDLLSIAAQHEDRLVLEKLIQAVPTFQVSIEGVPHPQPSVSPIA